MQHLYKEATASLDAEIADEESNAAGVSTASVAHYRMREWLAFNQVDAGISNHFALSQTNTLI